MRRICAAMRVSRDDGLCQAPSANRIQSDVLISY